jgi:hypothetical protein
MKDGKIVLIAYHLLESSLGTYIEWSVNELMMTANKKKYKDAHFSNASCRYNKPTSQKVFLLTGKSCGVQLSTHGLFYPVEGDMCR